MTSLLPLRRHRDVMAVSDMALRISRGDAQTRKDKRELVDRTVALKPSRGKIELILEDRSIFIGTCRFLTSSGREAERLNVKMSCCLVSPHQRGH